MTIKIGDIAPDFTVETTEGTLRFHEWLGSHWGIHIILHPHPTRLLLLLLPHPPHIRDACGTALPY